MHEQNTENKMQLVLATELITDCHLPELKVDIDSRPFERADFQKFNEKLNANLHLIFDLIQIHKTILFQQCHETIEFQSKFILLLCEQLNKSDFQTDEILLQQNIIALRKDYFLPLVSNDTLVKEVFSTFKSKLRSDIWKRNIGSVYGFRKFCELYYVEHKFKLLFDDALFLLSVGSILIEYFEDSFKEMAIDIFQIILECCDLQDLQSANIHEAIYSTSFKYIKIIKNEFITIKNWNCIYKSVSIDQSNRNDGEWNRLDDIISSLCNRIVFENNGKLVTIFYYFIAKFCTIKSRDSNDKIQMLTDFINIEQQLKISIENNLLVDKINVEQFKNVEINNFSVYRWLKKLLNLYINQADFFGNRYDVLFRLQALHTCYLICIYPAQILKLLPKQTAEFLTKFSTILTDLSKRFIGDNLIQSEVQKFMTTLTDQVQKDMPD